MRKKSMDSIERKIEITREKLANLEEEYKCILRQSVATGAFASGHLALRVAGS